MSKSEWWDNRRIRHLYPGRFGLFRGENLVSRADVGVGLLVILYDEPTASVGALHAIIPAGFRSKSDDSQERFWSVTDGFKELLGGLLEFRAMGESRDFHVLVFGAAELQGQPDITLPEQNLAALRKEMNRYSVSSTLERTGGQGIRTVYVDCQSLRYAILQNGLVQENH